MKQKTVCANIYLRLHRSMSRSVLFFTSSDEHTLWQKGLCYNTSGSGLIDSADEMHLPNVLSIKQ